MVCGNNQEKLDFSTYCIIKVVVKVNNFIKLVVSVDSVQACVLTIPRWKDNLISIYLSTIFTNCDSQ